MTYGPYYPEILNNTTPYLCKHPEIRKFLEFLKANGKIIFFVSNSHFDYMNNLMKFSYGDVFFIFIYALGLDKNV